MRTIEILESILKYVLYHGKMDKKKKNSIILTLSSVVKLERLTCITKALSKMPI